MSDQLWAGRADVAPDERFGAGSGGAYVWVLAIAGTEYEFTYTARRVLEDHGYKLVVLEGVRSVDDAEPLGEELVEIGREVIATGEAALGGTFYVYPEVDEE